MLSLWCKVQIAQDRNGSGILNLVGVIILRFTGVERHPNQAGLGQCVVGHNRINALLQDDRHAISGPQAALQQAVANAVSGHVQLSETHLALFINQGDVVAVCQRGTMYQVTYFHVFR